jgi:hypothetical protein
MSNKYYIKENDDGSTITYNKRILYNVVAEDDQDEYMNLVDFNLGEKFFYGRVNRNFIPMYANVERLRGLGTSNGAHQDTSQVVAFDFVVQAFQDLQNQFDRQVAAAKINANLDFLSNIKIYKSYLDPIDLFIEHQDMYTSQIIQHFSDKNIKVKNFSEFLKHFIKLIEKSASQYPFTFSGFMKSKYCPINTSGLVIEIADEDYFNDLSKIDQFINSPNWLFYLNTCRSYGFLVDKNIPWRLVANIASPEMLEYSRNFAITNTDEIINLYYDRTDNIYFDKFRLYLHKLYHDVILDEKITVLEDCNGRTVAKVIIPEKYSIQKLERIFDDRALLKMYFDIRIMEEEMTLDDSEKNRIYRDCLSIQTFKNTNEALFNFETIINHPFDYNGSLSYHLDRTKKGYGGKIVLPDIR